MCVRQKIHEMNLLINDEIFGLNSFNSDSEVMSNSHHSNRNKTIEFKENPFVTHSIYWLARIQRVTESVYFMFFILITHLSIRSKSMIVTTFVICTKDYCGNVHKNLILKKHVFSTSNHRFSVFPHSLSMLNIYVAMD